MSMKRITPATVPVEITAELATSAVTWAVINDLPESMTSYSPFELSEIS